MTSSAPHVYAGRIRKADPAFSVTKLICAVEMCIRDSARAAVLDVDGIAMEEAREHHGRLTKPTGSLGELELLGVRLAGMAHASPPPVPEPATVAFWAIAVAGGLIVRRRTARRLAA